MRRNSIVLGQRKLEGDYGRILAAGELSLVNSRVRRLIMAGSARVQDSEIGRLRVTGEVRGKEVVFGKARVVGRAELNGLCKAGTFAMTGGMRAEDLECRVLKCAAAKKGKVKDEGWSGFFRADTFENECYIKLNFDYDFKNIVSAGRLVSDGEISCENFYSFGSVEAECINADNIMILLHEGVKVRAVTGSSIRIEDVFRADKLWKGIPKTMKCKYIKSDGSMVRVSDIEDDIIKISNTKADFVSGDCVYINDLCIINKVEYKSDLKISPKAVVNEVIKL